MIHEVQEAHHVIGILQDNDENIILDLDADVNPFDVPVSRYQCRRCQRVMHYYVGDNVMAMKCPRCQSMAKSEQATVNLIIQGGSVFYRGTNEIHHSRNR